MRIEIPFGLFLVMEDKDCTGLLTCCTIFITIGLLYTASQCFHNRSSRKNKCSPIRYGIEGKADELDFII